MLLLCKLAVPSWADVEMADFTMDALGGGFSGNVPIKCSAKGKSTLAVKVNVAADEEDGLVNAAFKNFSKVGIVPHVHLLGDPRAPGLEVYEFVHGKSLGFNLGKHGAEWLVNEADAKSFGSVIAKMHGAPAEWYEKYKDHVKGQWEAWFDTPSPLADEFKGKYGDYAWMVTLWGNKFKGGGQNAAAVCSYTDALTPLLYAQLPPDTLLGRMVVGHGDCHGANVMHSEVDGHGDLVLIDLDFCGKFPAAIDVLGTTLGMDGTGIVGYFFAGGSPVGEYPTLASRRLVAQAYLDGLGGDVVGKYKRTSVDELVYDMEIGAACRWHWLAPAAVALGFNSAPICLGWHSLYYAKAATEIFESANTDAALKQKVLEQGVSAIITAALLAKGCKPLGMTPEQFESIWNEFGTLLPGFKGPFPDDTPPAAEKEEKVKEGSFRCAALKHFASTGADLDSVFAKFDTDNSGSIDLKELLACAVECGAGFKSTAEAEATMAELDADGDGLLSLDEFKAYLKKK